MKRLQTILLAACVALIFTSCAPTYLPNGLHTPLLYEKGEIEVNISTGTNQFDGQVAAAIANHLAIMGNFASANFNDESSGEFSRHRLAEFAVGTFFPIGSAGSFEAYAGYGRGRGDSKDEGLISNNNTFITAEGNYNRLFLQTNIGVTTKFVEAGLGLRASHLSFSNYTENGTVFSDPPSALFIEPAMFLRLGGGSDQKWNVKGFMQLGFSAPVAQEIEFDHQGLIVNLGVSFRFNRLYQKERIRDIRN